MLFTNFLLPGENKSMNKEYIISEAGKLVVEEDINRALLCNINRGCNLFCI